MKVAETLTSAQYRERYAGKAKPHIPKKKHSNKGCFHIEVILIDKGVKFEKEYVFHPKRKWRFDFAIVESKIAIEYEGGVFGGGKSRHTTGKGYTEDAEKYREATKLGWRVLRYTSKGYSKLIEDLKQIL